MPPLAAVILVLLLVWFLAFATYRQEKRSSRRFLLQSLLIGPAVWLFGLFINPELSPLLETRLYSLAVLFATGFVPGGIFAFFLFGNRWRTHLEELFNNVNHTITNEPDGVIRVMRRRRRPMLPSPSSQRQLVYCRDCGCWVSADNIHRHATR
jgi:hypothetical protein